MRIVPQFLLRRVKGLSWVVAEKLVGVPTHGIALAAR
jgi:hypothetical protein